MTSAESTRQNDGYTAAELVDLGLAEHRKGNLDAAAIHYQMAIDQDNHQSDALHLLGMIAFQLGHPEKAEKLILLAIQNNPNVPVYYNNLGNLYLESGAAEFAIEAYQKAVDLKQDYTEAKFNLANAYVEYGDYGMAEIFYIRALELAPDFSMALKNLGELYILQQKWIEASRCYEELVDNDPENEDYKIRFSDLLVTREGDIENLVADMKRAILLNDMNLDAKLKLAEYYLQHEQVALANDLFDAVLALDSENYSGLVGKASVLNKGGHHQLASELLAKAESILNSQAG